MTRPIRTAYRRLCCRLGLHRWQYLLAPSDWRKGDDYAPGIYCIFCNVRHHIEPGSLK